MVIPNQSTRAQNLAVMTISLTDIAAEGWSTELFRLQYTFRSTIFSKFRFFGLSNDPNEFSNVKKESLKKIKYWQRNGSFQFWPEVKITHLIDVISAVFTKQFFLLRRTL